MRVRESRRPAYYRRVMTYVDPTDTRAQERDAEAQEAGARARRERELNDLRWLLAHPQGRRIASRLLDRAGVFRSSFNTSGSVMAFSEGKRDAGLFLMAELTDASPDGLTKVLNEYKATK